jgi:hypothetical protein
MWVIVRMLMMTIAIIVIIFVVMLSYFVDRSKKFVCLIGTICNSALLLGITVQLWTVRSLAVLYESLPPIL